MSQPAARDDADLAWLRQCDELGDAFESAWKSGVRPQLAEFMKQIPAERRADLLRVLLPLDWEYRTDAGETPRIAEYTTAWPDHAELIAEVLSPTSIRLRLNSRDASVDPLAVTVIRSDSLTPTVTAPAQALGPVAKPESQFGAYTLLRELGRGGMGVVYLARHEKLNRFAALKVIRSGELAGAEEIRRFEAEAAAAAQLDHPGIVPVFESGTHQGHHFLAMAYVEGETLGHRIQDHPLEPAASAVLIKQVALAVEHAHQRGVVHRDLKPQNILLSADGQPRVTDFGLAKRTAADANLTATGDVLGTPGYMPPEQASGRMDRVGPAADVYSLGATLYCALTGRPPFQAANPWDTLRLVCEHDPVSPRILNPAIPRDLETVCLKCLRKDPQHRYASAAELAGDLHRFLTNVPILARPVGSWERGWRWCLRNRTIAGALALITGLLVTIAAGSTWAWSRQTYLTKEMSSLAGKEKVQKELAETAKEKALVQLHHSQVARGVTALDAGNFTRAELALDDTAPFELRGWEYRYLKRRQMGTPLTFVSSGFPLLEVAYSADGREFATASLIGEIERWNAADGQRLQQVRLEGGSPSTLLYHPRQRELIIVMRSGFVTCWDLDRQAARLTWRAHEQPVGSADISFDGQTLVTSSADATVKSWDLATGKERLTFQGHRQPVQCVAISPDGTSVASGTSNAGSDVKFELIHWNLADGTILRQVTGDFAVVNLLRFHPDGSRIATVTGVGVTLWDAKTLNELTSFPKHTGAITSLAFSPDGRLLSTTAFDGDVRVVDASTGELRHRFGHHVEMTQNAVFHPDGYRLATVSGQLKSQAEKGQYTSGEGKVWNLRTPEQESWIGVDERNVDPVTNYLNAVDFQPGTAIVATGGWRGKVRLVDVLERRDVQPPVDFGSVVTSLTFHPTLPVLAMTGALGGPQGGMALFDLRDRKLTALRGHSGQIGFAQFSPDGKTLATTGIDGVIKLWNPETAQELGTLTGHKPELLSLAFSRDSKQLVTANKDRNEIKVWDVQRRKELKEKPSLLARGIVSPEGSLEAVRGDGGVLEIWNASDQSLRHRLIGHLADVSSLTFSADGRRLVSAGRDGTIIVWDPQEGVESLRIELENDFPNEIALSSDGSLLACATQVGVVQVWDARIPGDNLKLKGHTDPIDAYGFTDQGTLLSRDTAGKIIAWSLPDGVVDANGPQDDPTPLPATSPDGAWSVTIDRRDRTALVVMRRRNSPIPFAPWEEENARMNQLAPGWHAEDARAAEERSDWFAAAFHLAAMLEFSENPEIRQRLKAACVELDKAGRMRPGNVKED